MIGFRLSFILLMTVVSLYSKTFSSFEEAEKAFMLYGDKEAQAYVISAGEKGHPKGQYYLAYMYLYGEKGFPKDEKKGIELFRQSADNGESSAQLIVGDMYRDGMGVHQDYFMAVNYYQKAAEQNSEQGLSSLAWMFQEGIGVNKNIKIAYMLNTLSSKCKRHTINVENNARELSKRLSTEELSEANLLLENKDKFWLYVNKAKKEEIRRKVVEFDKNFNVSKSDGIFLVKVMIPRDEYISIMFEPKSCMKNIRIYDKNNDTITSQSNFAENFPLKIDKQGLRRGEYYIDFHSKSDVCSVVFSEMNSFEEELLLFKKKNGLK